MNELLNRLKNSINKEILNHINDALMEQNKFVPINFYNNDGSPKRESELSAQEISLRPKSTGFLT